MSEQQNTQQPVAWMLECPTMTGDTCWKLSWNQSGAGVCNRLSGKDHEKALYTAPPVLRDVLMAALAEMQNEAIAVASNPDDYVSLPLAIARIDIATLADRYASQVAQDGPVNRQLLA